MSFKLTQSQVGRQIAELRKRKGLSQDELAKCLDISRPSLTQIELGNRNLDVQELQKLAAVLGFSLDDFFSENFNPGNNDHPPSEIDNTLKKERISVPALNVSKFKNVLLYILERCAGKPNVGETVLYKLLYFCDFNHYELYEEHLTGAKYRKLPYGPVPLRIDSIIGRMIQDNQIQRIKTEYYDKLQTRYIPLVKPNLALITGAEKEVIDRVIDQMSDWSATSISDYSHKDLPWQITDEGKEISYELAFYRELPYSVRVYDETED